MLHDISGRLDPALVNAISEVKVVADSVSVPFFIIGATARDIIFEHCHSIPAPRATLDIDLAAQVPDWAKFKAVCDALLATGNFSKAKEKQKYLCRGVRIDIVPFGGIGGRDKRISWPPEHEVIMSTLGFDEAYKHAVTVRLSKDPQVDIKIATIPGLAIMKLISWHEKYPERERDAEDLLFIMEKYEHAGIDDRLFEQELSLLNEERDYRFAAIRLLGRDMARMSDPLTFNKIKEILSAETVEQEQYKLITHMLRSPGKRDEFDEVLLMLRKLEQGVLDKLE